MKNIDELMEELSDLTISWDDLTKLDILICGTPNLEPRTASEWFKWTPKEEHYYYDVFIDLYTLFLKYKCDTIKPIKKKF